MSGESPSKAKKFDHLKGEASGKQRGLLSFLIKKSELEIPEGWSVYKIQLSKQEASDLIGDMKKGDNTGLLPLLMRKPEADGVKADKVSSKELCEAVIQFFKNRSFKNEETQTEAKEVLRKAEALHAFVLSKGR